MRTALGLLLSLLTSALCGAAEPAAEVRLWDEAKLSPPRYEVRMENNVLVPMRDGVLLSTDIYYPVGEGPFPVVLSRTPYGNNDAGYVEHGRFWASRGYVCVVQDCRGKYDSEGAYRLFKDEANDGYDTVEWIGRQPWCNGKVGTLSGSYGGYTQLAPAIRGSRFLTAMAASVTTSDVYNNWVYIDGALFLGFAFPWGALVMDGHVMQYSGAYDWPNVFRYLPLATIDTQVGRVNPRFREWLEHPRADDPFWKGISFENEIEQITVPLLVVEGWYDLFLRGALDDHVRITTASPSERARKGKHLIIGPWPHETGARTDKPDAPREGPERGIDFGAAAELEMRKLYLRWHDHWLKGIDNGVDSEPPVKIFVMGENVWRHENEWPLARTRYTNYYFGGEGPANSVAGNGTLSPEPPRQPGRDEFTYDPNDPVPTLGGNTCCSRVPSGPANQIAAERRQDVLVYTTPVLEEALEVTGPIRVVLYAATSARDTDWTAKLVDVHPDGYAQNLQDGIVRARYRKGKAAPAELLEPGRVYEYEIDLWATSNVFLPGHRLRVEISSSNFPRFDRNLNTGEDPMTSVRMETARQTVMRSPEYPSHIVLPVIPR